MSARTAQAWREFVMLPIELGKKVRCLVARRAVPGRPSRAAARRERGRARRSAAEPP